MFGRKLLLIQGLVGSKGVSQTFASTLPHLVANVSPRLHASKVHLGQAPIGSSKGGIEICRLGHCRQHPAATGDQWAWGSGFSSGIEQLSAVGPSLAKTWASIIN